MEDLAKLQQAKERIAEMAEEIAKLKETIERLLKETHLEKTLRRRDE